MRARRRIINATEVGLDGVPPYSMFGDPVTDFFNWAAHDPATLAPNLRWTKLYMYYGNGLPGPLDTGPRQPGRRSAIEARVYELTTCLPQPAEGARDQAESCTTRTATAPTAGRTGRATCAGASATIMSDFAHPRRTRASFSYDDRGQPSYSVYGWQVDDAAQGRRVQHDLRRPARPRSRSRARGTATVTTPARYKRHTRYRITVQLAVGTTTSDVDDTGVGQHA